MLKLLRLAGERRKTLIRASGVSSLGIEMGLAVAIGYFGGHWLDGELGTAPYLTYLGLLIGFGAGFKGVFRLARRYSRENQPAPRSRGETSDA